jgi:metallophosphoesterase (TIGR03767 family)
VPNITRRSLFAAGTGGLVLAALARSSVAQAADRAFRYSRARSTYTEGTTLEQVARPDSNIGYRRLVSRPGYPLLIREDLAQVRSNRDARVDRASIVQFTDLHLIDAQSPMRFEYMVALDASAFRPQEALGTQAAAQLVQRVNELASGPISGRAFDCVVMTGDSSDNSESIEMDWFLSVMNGGTITQNSGSPTEWEGVQSSGKRLFYNPELDIRDDYKAAGFPHLHRYFSRAMAPHVSQGLDVPWYSVFGNHDDSIGGTVPASWSMLEEIYTGGIKFQGFTDENANHAIEEAFRGDKPNGARAVGKLRDHWEITPDERRRPFTPREFIAAHLADDAIGPGPAGHGFSPDAVETGDAFYTFEIAPGVTGVSLDTTNRSGYTEGSLSEHQFVWLQSILKAGSSTYYDIFGQQLKHLVDDRYFVLFSHHTSHTMKNSTPDPDTPGDIRHLGSEVAALVHRFPNVLAWVNGHTHSNRITAHPGATPQQSFWEINTASHVEFPQQARIIEVCDNRDGTLSLFTTLIESTAPYQASYSGSDQASLASLYREFSANDLNFKASHSGTALDHNTELLLVDPQM